MCTCYGDTPYSDAIIANGRVPVNQKDGEARGATPRRTRMTMENRAMAVRMLLKSRAFYMLSSMSCTGLMAACAVRSMVMGLTETTLSSATA